MIKTNGSIGVMSLKSILPALKNVNILVKFPMDADNLFVAMAAEGGRPNDNNTGKIISAPPPTTALMNAAINPNKIKMIQVSKSSSIIRAPI